VTRDCDFDITSEISSHIGTVGIVNWSVDLDSLDSAKIEFGLDTDYGYVAPVDLDEPDFRTLLLGMKAEREYHFRVTAVSGDTQCTSEDQTLTTGPLATGLPNIDITTDAPDALAGGFLLTGGRQGGPAYILDRDGDVVWWQPRSDENNLDWDNVSRMHMSYDGKYMWIGGGFRMLRVAMDGSSAEVRKCPRISHDFTVLPDEKVFSIYEPPEEEGGNRLILECNPDDNTYKVVVDLGTFFDNGFANPNAIQYSPEDDTIVVSVPTHDAYVKITREGELVWILGEEGDFTFTNEGWETEHSAHVLGLDGILLFNNGAPSQAKSRAIEYKLDLETMEATRVWTYEPEPSIYNGYFGDVQRLHNGNTLVTFSAAGVVHEVDEAGTVLQSMSWELGANLGYSTKRESLYGPPPR